MSMEEIQKARRETFRRQFAAFMDRTHHDGWSKEDDDVLREIAVTYFEFVTGLDGEPIVEEVFNEVEKAAKKLGSAYYSKLGDYLKNK